MLIKMLISRDEIVLDFLFPPYIIKVNKDVGFSTETMPALFPYFLLRDGLS